MAARLSPALLHGLCPVFGSQSFNSARCLSPSSDVLKVLDSAVEGFELVIFVMLRKLEHVTGLDHVFIYSIVALLGFRGSLPWRRPLFLAVYILR